MSNHSLLEMVYTDLTAVKIPAIVQGRANYLSRGILTRQDGRLIQRRE